MALKGTISERDRSPDTIGRKSSLNLLLLSAEIFLRKNKSIQSVERGTIIIEKVETKEPKNPHFIKPTNVAAFIDIGPGVTCDKAIS